MADETALRRLRKEAELTQEALARETGLSLSSINSLERKVFQPSVETARKITAALAEALDREITIEEAFPEEDAA